MPQSCNLLFLEKVAVLSFHLYFSFPCRSHVEYIIHNQANGATESVRILIPALYLYASSIDPRSVDSGKLGWGLLKLLKELPALSSMSPWYVIPPSVRSLVFSPSFRDTVSFIGQTLHPFNFTFLRKALRASLYLSVFSPPPQPFEPVGTFQDSY